MADMSMASLQLITPHMRQRLLAAKSSLPAFMPDSGHMLLTSVYALFRPCAASLRLHMRLFWAGTLISFG